MDKVKQPENLPAPPESTVENEATFEIVEEALVNLWRVVDDLWRIRPPKPEYYRVTIFGSSRIRRGTQLYSDVRQLAAELSAMGCDIVTGAGPGLMQAANEGVRLGDPHNRTRSYGISIELASEQEPNPFVEKVYRHRTFFSRLHHFVLLSSAFVVVPGGIGTTLETMLIWQLLQVRHAHGIPLILVGPMWKGLVAWARENMARPGLLLAGPEDIGIPTCVDTVEDAVVHLRKHYEEFKNLQAVEQTEPGQ
jgi:predicted Rossmann-fold nucleotide-binding protein